MREWFFAYAAFYPTLWYNLALCKFNPQRRWWDWIDETVLLGALPLKSHVPKLKSEGIGAVINTCQEYRGPLDAYRAAGIDELYLPTIDFTPPRLEDIQRGVDFIQRHAEAGRKVYIHCKAGRGRSATIAMCYLITRGHTPDSAQALLTQKRPQVNQKLAKRMVVLEFAAGNVTIAEGRK